MFGKSFISLLVFLAIGGLVANEVSYPQQEVEKIFSELVDEDAHVRDSATERMALLGKVAFDHVVEKFPQVNYQVRRQIVTILDKIHTPQALDLLFLALQDPDEGVRNRVALALLNLSESPDKIITRLDAVENPRSEVRSTIQDIKNSFLYKFVEIELAEEISPQGGYGFYDGQFDSLKEVGETIIAPLSDIFCNGNYSYIQKSLNEGHQLEKQFKMRMLAGQALGELSEIMSKGNKRMVIRRLRGLAYSSLGDEEIRRIASCARYKLGDKIEFERQVKQHLKNISLTQTPDSYRELAMLYLRVNESEKGILYLKMSISLCQQAGLENEAGLDYYNLACAYSYINNIEEAITALLKAVDLKYEDVEWMKQDGDLRNLHDDPRFQEIIKKLEEKKELLKRKK